MTELDILSALNSQMEVFRAANPIDIAYPNIDYAPVQGTSFLDVNMLSGDIIQASIGTESKNRSTGIYQVDVYTPVSEGTYASKTIIDNLFPYFNRGTVITNGDTQVRITGFRVGIAFTDPDWYRQVVEITYRSDINNT